MTSSRQDKPSSWVSERVSYADIVKNLEGGVGRRDDNGSEGRSRNGIRESLAPQNKFKKTLKIHLDPNGRRRVEWVLERRVQQPRSPLRLALSKGPPEIHKSQQQPKKRVNWALHDTTRKNGTKRANESRVEELGQVKAQSSLKKVVNGSDGGRNEAIRPLALTWVAKGVDKVKKGTEVMGSVLGPVSGEGSEYNSSTHASSKGKEVIQEVDLGPSCSGTKGEMTSHSFFDAEALSSDTSDTETVDDDSLISHFENEEGLLIEQLEREFMEEQKQQNKEAEVPLDGFAVLFGGEGEEATHGGSTMSYILLTLSSWFMALSWLFAPYLFNPSGFEWQKVVEDFRDWTNWLLYRGGIGVKGEESWEAWWDEELAHIRSIGSRIAETILSLRFFIFQYGIVYKLHLQGDDTSLTVYGLSWIVLAVLIILFKVFSFSQKISVNFQLLLRFIQGLSFMLALAGLVVAVIFTKLSVPDIFACILAFIPTGWGILSIAAAWKPVMKRVGLWKSIRSIARLYDAGMGMLIFIPIALFSWFPFVSTFQTRLMFNQAFSRGLEISLILAGNNPNTGPQMMNQVQMMNQPQVINQSQIIGQSQPLSQPQMLIHSQALNQQPQTQPQQQPQPQMKPPQILMNQAKPPMMNRGYKVWPQQPPMDPNMKFQNPMKPNYPNSKLGRSNWKGKKVTDKRKDPRRMDKSNPSGSLSVQTNDVGYKPPTLHELQSQNRLKARKFYPKKKFNNRFAPYAPRNTTSFLIRAKKSGGIASLVSPCPVTPSVLPTPIFSPSREVLGDMAKEEWGVDGYGSMKGLIRLRSPGHEAEVHEDEEDEEGGAGSSDSDVEEHVEVERRLDHDLSRFEMIYPNYGVDYNNVLENRVDDQDSHIAQLEEENLTMKERLFLMERELGDLRRRLQFLERQNQIVEDVNEEVVENGSDNESEGGSDAPVVGTEKNAEMVDYVPHGRNEDGDANGKVKNDGVSGGIGDVYMEEFIPDNVIANKNEINCEVRNQFVFDEEKDKLKDEKATEGYIPDEVGVKENVVGDQKGNGEFDVVETKNGLEAQETNNERVRDNVLTENDECKDGVVGTCLGTIRDEDLSASH
ncbi:PRLI-interacting factor A [Senna tora]|uniref:PRLI-interacting factor A n=1 Tax=Senna tora TaxID=362788 RepID=A0A834X357_9FABA|nr:PRLI-interacting factor A [Senna tora]